MTTTTTILITRRWPAEIEQLIAASLGTSHKTVKVDFHASDTPLTSEDIDRAMQDYDIICPTVTDKITATHIRNASRKTRLLANYGVGFNNIDVAAAAANGVMVTNTPDVLTDATADIALTLMLGVARGAGRGERMIRSNTWAGWNPMHFSDCRDVTGATLGLVGMGRIGLVYWLLSLARKPF